MINLGLFSKYRTELMGVATILIILCHMPAHGVAMPSFLQTIIVHGGSGCDIFLFLSGLGLYNSLHGKYTNMGGIIIWYKKRFARLLVPYILICAPVFAFFAFREQWAIGQFIMRLSTLSFWTEGWGLWFVALIIVLYLLTPLLDKVLTGRRKWFWLTALVLLTWLSDSVQMSDVIVTNVQFGLCRVPCYLIGYALAKEIVEGRELLIWPVISIALFLYILSQMISHFTGIGISDFWLEGIVLCILFACLADLLQRVRLIQKLLRFMGNISLESYCTNVFLLPFFLYLPWKVRNINFNPGNWSYYLLGTVGCILVSWIVNQVSQPIIHTIVRNGK